VLITTLMHRFGINVRHLFTVILALVDVAKLEASNRSYALISRLVPPPRAVFSFLYQQTTMTRELVLVCSSHTLCLQVLGL